MPLLQVLVTNVRQGNTRMPLPRQHAPQLLQTHMYPPWAKAIPHLASAILAIPSGRATSRNVTSLREVHTPVQHAHHSIKNMKGIGMLLERMQIQKLASVGLDVASSNVITNVLITCDKSPNMRLLPPRMIKLAHPRPRQCPPLEPRPLPQLTRPPRPLPRPLPRLPGGYNNSEEQRDMCGTHQKMLNKAQSNMRNQESESCASCNRDQCWFCLWMPQLERISFNRLIVNANANSSTDSTGSRDRKSVV